MSPGGALIPVPLLEMRGIVKRYGHVLALDGATLVAAGGEVHALLGENGAGKSTLMKVLGGAIARDEGFVRIGGKESALGTPAASFAAGITVIPQDLLLVPELSVADNVFLGIEKVRGRSPWLDRASMDREARAVLATLGCDADPRARVGSLPVAVRQLVEIARALVREARVLAFDEPTAALGDEEADALFETIRRLRDRGAAILYISHRLDEVLALADRVTVLRDGKDVATAPISEVDRGQLIRWMVGRDVAGGAPSSAPPSDAREVLRVSSLAGGRVRGVDLAVGAGEIVGLAGLVGSGRSETARLIFGAERPSAGTIELEGRAIAPRSPREAIDAGIGLLTEDRNRLGLVLGMSVRENVTLPTLARYLRGPFVDRRRERGEVVRLAGRLQIKAPTIETAVDRLSGGNRQKVVLARWLSAGSKVLIFDEPTAGVDVGARSEIHEAIRARAAAGTAVVVISSDVDELLALCGRIAVMCEGRIEGELTPPEATAEKIMALATAHRERRASA